MTCKYILERTQMPDAAFQVRGKRPWPVCGNDVHTGSIAAKSMH